MRRRLQQVGNRVLDLLNAVLPKREQLLLNLYPDTDASLPPLLEACRDVEGRVVVLLTDPTSTVADRVREALGTRVRVLPRGSLGAAWQYLRSGSVVFTHPVHTTARLSRRQTVVDVWHGIPIKAIGRLDGVQDAVLADWTLAGSEFFRPVLAEALGVPPESVVVLNSPRIEHLCRGHADVWERLGIDRAPHDRVLVWMPTFRGREPARGGAGVRSAPLLSPDGLTRLAAVLERRRCLLVLRRHPYEAQAAPVSVPGVVELTDAVLEAAGVGVYDVLAESDGLLTDLSSVWLDYLPLDRPVVIWFPDLDAYTADRPLLLDPYPAWTPGPVLDDEDDLLAAVDAVAAARTRTGSAGGRCGGPSWTGTPRGSPRGSSPSPACAAARHPPADRRPPGHHQVDGRLDRAPLEAASEARDRQRTRAEDVTAVLRIRRAPSRTGLGVPCGRSTTRPSSRTTRSGATRRSVLVEEHRASVGRRRAGSSAAPPDRAEPATAPSRSTRAPPGRRARARCLPRAR